MLRHVFLAYEQSLHARPLMTKVLPSRPSPRTIATRIYIVRLLHGRRVCRFAPQAVTSAAIGGIGDLTQQSAFEKKGLDIDLRRLCTFTALGGLLVAPVRLHFFLCSVCLSLSLR